MRTAWKGTLQFGLLAIPLRLGTAADSRQSLFHHAHRACGTRIRQKRWCETCQGEVPDFADVGKGVELADGSVVLVTDEELDQLRAWQNKVITLLHFTPAAQVDPLLFDAHYYAEPVDGGGPAHALLLSAMGEGVAAVCTIGYRDRCSLALLRPRDGMFVLTTLRWPAEVRPADVKIPPAAAARPQEAKMAAQLVKSMTRDFDPAAHTDTYREALVALVMEKEAGTPSALARPADPAKRPSDMLAALTGMLAEQKTKTKPRARRAPAAKAS